MPVTGDFTCSGCSFPMCSPKCEDGARHKRECAILGAEIILLGNVTQFHEFLTITLTLLDAGRCKDWPEALRIKGSEEASNAYSVIAPLRLLLLQRSGSDGWARSDQLMDHLDDRHNCDDDWQWYDRYIVDFIRNDLGMADVFTDDQVLLCIICQFPDATY